MKKLVLIARVSTADQPYSLTVQAEKCQQWCAQRGYELVVLESYPPVSGAAKRRPDIERALELCRLGQAHGIIALRLDRLARSLSRLTELAHELAAMGADLVCVEQAVDTTTPAGRLVYHMLGAVAEFERDLIAQRTREAMAVARDAGVHVGRPAGAGLVAQRERVRELAAMGWCTADIARETGLHRTQVVRLLGLLGHPEPTVPSHHHGEVS